LALRFGSYFVIWFLGCFALATIASVVNKVEDKGDDTAWIPDRHQRAREHLGPVFVAAWVTFCAFLVGMAVSQFVLIAASRVFGWHRVSRFTDAAELFAIVTVASLVSWLGASIPLIIRGTKGWSALKRSVELSSGYEGALLLLVAESLAGSFAVGYSTLYALHYLMPTDLRHASWYAWVVALATALTSATVEAPLFLGFSLLADPEFHNASSLPVSQHPS